MFITAGTIVGGKYRLERPLSRGGMGAVWAARHVHLGAPVAIKFMDATYASTPSFRSRFEREARTAANLQSPHVVHVQDYGIDDGIPYIVMELLEGEDLQRRIERGRRLPLAEMSRILVQVGKALRRAHDAGLVHRDLKPRNVFLARIDDEEIAKILDFGIAKETTGEISGDATRTGELMGSPHYMSPEQLRAEKDLDPRSDLWAVGVLVFRCLTGRLPFAGEALGAVMAKILVDPVPPMIEVAPDLPPWLDGFFARALARDRAQRFSSIRELVEAFVAGAGGAPAGATIAGAYPPLSGPPSGSGPHPLVSPVFTPWPGPPTAASLFGGMTPVPSSSAPGLAHAPETAHLATPTHLRSGAQPADLLGAIPAETLVTAGITGATAARARRARTVWLLAAAAGVLLLAGGVLTAIRLAGSAPDDPPADEPAPAARPDTPPSEVAPRPPEPAPAAPPPAPSAEPAAAAAADPSAAAASRPSSTSTKKTSKPAPTQTKPAPTATASAKKPTWGF